MNKKVAAILGLLICLLGVYIQIFENNGNNFIPEFLEGRSLYLLIIGSSFSSFYSLQVKEKKDK